MNKLTNVIFASVLGAVVAWAACGVEDPETQLSTMTKALACHDEDRSFDVQCEYYLNSSRLSNNASISATVICDGSGSGPGVQYVKCVADKNHACACKWYLDRSTGTCGEGSYVDPEAYPCTRRLYNGGVSADADIEWITMCDAGTDPDKCCSDNIDYFVHAQCKPACQAEDPTDRNDAGWVTLLHCCEDMSGGGETDGGSTSSDGGTSSGD